MREANDSQGNGSALDTVHVCFLVEAAHELEDLFFFGCFFFFPSLSVLIYVYFIYFIKFQWLCCVIFHIDNFVLTVIQHLCHVGALEWLEPIE